MTVVPLFAAPPQPQPKDFEDFWRAYPRRKDKLDAMRAWRKAIRLAPAETIIAAAAKYAKSADPNYTKLPATWLNKGSFLDEEDPVPEVVDPRESRLRSMASMIRKANEGGKFAADWVRNNVTEQDREEMKARGLIS